MSRQNYRRLPLSDMYRFFGRCRKKCPICGRVGTLKDNIIIHTASERKSKGMTSVEVVEWCDNRKVNGGAEPNF